MVRSEASVVVTRTPAVLVDGEIVVSGRVPAVAELVTLFAAKNPH